MKSLIILSALFAVTVPYASAQQPEAAQRGAAVDAVHARMLDAEALAWAWRIEKTKDVSYEGLTRQAANWGMGEAARERLFGRIKELVNRGQVRRLTRAERAVLEEGRAEIKAIVAGEAAVKRGPVAARAAKESKVDAAAREMLDVEAKYWAWRIAAERNITYNELEAYSQGWVRGAEVSGELLARVKARLQAGETGPLTAAEQGRLDAGNKKISDLVRRG